jgi:hypothetical protein
MAFSKSWRAISSSMASGERGKEKRESRSSANMIPWTEMLSLSAKEKSLGKA